MIPDPYEFARLQRENEWLREQVRTLTARLNDRNPAHWVTVAADGSQSWRPETKLAAYRQVITDEVVERVNGDAMRWLLDRMMHAIERLSDKEPIDYLWTVTLEREYKA